MDESYQDPDVEETEEPESVGGWRISAEEIRALSPEQFREFVIGLHQRLGLLYDLELTRATRTPDQKPLTEQDILDILHGNGDA